MYVIVGVCVVCYVSCIVLCYVMVCVWFVCSLASVLVFLLLLGIDVSMEPVCGLSPVVVWRDGGWLLDGLPCVVFLVFGCRFSGDCCVVSSGLLCSLLCSCLEWICRVSFSLFLDVVFPGIAV